MPTDAGQPEVDSRITAGRTRSPADPARRAPPGQCGVASQTGTGRSTPSVEVELTSIRPRWATPAVARLNVAWLLFGAFGLTSLLASTTWDPRTGELTASSLILPMYLLAVAALIWAAFETRRATRRRRGNIGHGPDDRGQALRP
jgi:hypothetical protein